VKISIELESTEGQLRHVRRLVDGWAEAVEADGDTLSIIATELVSNAISASPAADHVVLWLDHVDDEARVSVMDGGPGFDLDSVGPPPVDAVGGRGLAIVDRLADRLEVCRADGHTVVTASTRARSPRGGSPPSSLGAPAQRHGGVSSDQAST
jgi:anti-sigma regulatory factor (Ser/Thr protein kinase)